MFSRNHDSHRFIRVALVLTIFISQDCLTGAAIAQDSATPAESPKWSLPKKVEEPALLKSTPQKSTQVDVATGLFDTKVQAAPLQSNEENPPSFPRQNFDGVEELDAPPTLEMNSRLLNPRQIQAAEITQPTNPTPQPRTALTVPIQTAPVQTTPVAPVQTEQGQAPASTVHRDPFLKQTGNSGTSAQGAETAFGADLEIPPLGNEPAPASFPSDSAPRMAPPTASIFPANPVESKPAATSTPDQSFGIESVETLKPSPAPQLSQPAPFSPTTEIPETTPNVPNPSSSLNTAQSIPKKQVYNPPANELVVQNQQPSDATNQIAEETVHEVQRGENYWTISRQHFGTARYFAALAEYNKHRIPRPDRMKPGMFVLVPDSKVLDQRYPKMAGIVDAQPSPESLLAPGFFIQDGQPLYRIGKGDTLTDIAENHLGRTARWSQIVGMNRDLLKDGNTLKIGMVLRLPHDASQVVLAPSGETIR